MDIKNIEEEYEYLEQMISIYKEKQKKIEKRFKNIENYVALLRFKEFLKIFIPANIIMLVLDRKTLPELDYAGLVQYEVQFGLISYAYFKLFGKLLETDKNIEKILAKEDLYQLAIDLYDAQEQEKGYNYQLKECNKMYFKEHSAEMEKIFRKK